MEEPAWKRLGLKVQSAPSTNEPDTKLAVEKRKRDQTVNSDKNDNESEKKPPKRKKVPKSERKPPPEADQLAYLRQFHEDRENWKFSKQKQNWVLKHCYEIAEDPYGEALIVYIQGLQGASRDRIAEEANEIIKKWNEFMSKEDNEEENKEETKEDGDDNKKEQTDQQKPPEESQAKRAQTIVKALTGEFVPLVLIDDNTNSGPDGEEKKEKEKKEKKEKKKEKKEKKEKKKEKRDKSK